MATDRALRELAHALRDDCVVTDPDVCAAYAKDESEARPIVPAAVVRAESTADVAAVMRVASSHGLPVTPRAGGTGRVGGAVPVEGGIVLTLEKMADLKDLDRANGTATVAPGLVTGELHARTEAEGLFYPPDPNSSAGCTIGGNIATNAGGPRALKYGVTGKYVRGLEVVTADGSVLALGRGTRKGVTGYDLASLIVGSEGTLAIVTEATLALVPAPEGRATLLAFFDDEARIEPALASLYAHRLDPRCAELLDARTLALMQTHAALQVPAGAHAMLLVELDGDLVAMDAALERAGNALLEAGALDVLAAKHGGDRERLWTARREMSRTLRGVARHKMSEDVVVPRTRLGELIRATREISEDVELEMPSYGHAGDGNLHVNFLWNDDGEWPRVERGIGALFRRVIDLGGALTGEHGIGIMKAPYLGLEQSADVIALESRIKALFDPKGVLNPGKIFPEAAKRFHGAC
ncbi:MAG: FAD-linked oxidase C-terminal domain-containing protein [Polyangiales bacterium]